VPVPTEFVTSRKMKSQQERQLREAEEYSRGSGSSKPMNVSCRHDAHRFLPHAHHVVGDVAFKRAFVLAAIGHYLAERWPLMVMPRLVEGSLHLQHGLLGFLRDCIQAPRARLWEE
jgi:hypothetical protein